MTPRESHGEASRLIAKLRDVRTEQPEFVYYTQRAYELLFNLAFGSTARQEEEPPHREDAGHRCPCRTTPCTRSPTSTTAIENTVMCVMLRGALLPSMIMSKEIQEYSSTGYVTPFALFKIKRDDTKSETNMEYILDLDRSYFDPEELDGKDLVFADPMNATGGSLVTVVKYLLDQGVKPRSIKFFNVISALKGALRIVRAIENGGGLHAVDGPRAQHRPTSCPGLGDAGDRINGRDEDEKPRDILQLIADYGTHIVTLYREQVRTIEQTVLGG